MNKRDSHNFWVMTAPVISDGHLTEKVATELVHVLPGEEFHGTAVMIGSHGALVSCDELETLSKTAPECLRKSLEWASGQGFEWVRFDEDGDIIEGLEMHQ